MPSQTFRALNGMSDQPPRLADSVLILIDCQNTYRGGVMELEGVEEALVEAQRLLARARAAGRPVIHIIHDDGPGSLFDIRAEIGQISQPVAPIANEAVIVKTYPSSFVKTDLDAQLKAMGASNLILAGFMTHMCINSTARAAFNHGYKPVVVASATATRSLPNPAGGALTAKEVHDGALTALADLFALVVRDTDSIPN